jgi:hypothetical protein
MIYWESLIWLMSFQWDWFRKKKFLIAKKSEYKHARTYTFAILHSVVLQFGVTRIIWTVEIHLFCSVSFRLLWSRFFLVFLRFLFSGFSPVPVTVRGLTAYSVSSIPQIQNHERDERRRGGVEGRKSPPAVGGGRGARALRSSAAQHTALSCTVRGSGRRLLHRCSSSSTAR